MMIPTLSSRPAEQQSNLFNTISRSSLLIGVIYLITAIIVFYFRTKYGGDQHTQQTSLVSFLTDGGAANVCKYIASGAFGAEALSGGMLMVVWGLVFHFMIAFGCTTVLFLLYPVLLKKLKNRWITGMVYGFAVWLIMYGGVLPLSSIRPEPFHAGRAAIDLLVIIVAVGIPAVIAAGNYRKKQSGDKAEN